MAAHPPVAEDTPGLSSDHACYCRYSERMAAKATSMGREEREVTDESQDRDVDLDQIAERLSWTPSPDKAC